MVAAMTRKHPRPVAASDGEEPPGLGSARPTEIQVPLTPLTNLPKRPSLTLISGVDAGKLFVLDAAETVIGRTHDSGVRINDVGISRRHARVLRGPDGSLVLEDLGSTNGIYRNGERTQRAQLVPGDKVQIGRSVLLRYSLLDVSEEAQARQLFEMSTRDALTRAYSRNYLTGRLTVEVGHADREGASLGLIMLDVDHFKRTNDTYGHIAGDTVLQAVAAHVARLIRADDVFARYGGEEFVVLLRSAPHGDVVRFAERIRKGIEELVIPFGEGVLAARVSVGVASLTDLGSPSPDAGSSAVDEERGAALLDVADKRLYKAKGTGRNRVVAA
jgi:diguanylate cyclase (GGDEF)-like protein